MRLVSSLNHRRHRRCAPTGYENNNKSKSRKRKVAVVIKVIKLISAILVPIMIGIFTIITTLRESEQARIQRGSDMERIERQAVLQREMDTLKMEAQQEYEEKSQREIRIQSVYDTYIRDMSSIAVKDKTNLTISEVLFARAKTLATLEQIDSKRKWYLVKFLYDSELLYANKSGMKYIDFVGADLSSVKFGADKKFTRRLNLENIRLSRVQLGNSSFENLALHQSNFHSSILSDSKFLDVSIVSSNFQETNLENSTLLLSNLQRTSFRDSQLKFSSWILKTVEKSASWEHIDYSKCVLSDASFRDMTFQNTAKFDEANFERIRFFNVKFSDQKIFKDMNMAMSTFIGVKLINGHFINCNMSGMIMERVHFSAVTFDHVDLRQSQFNDLSESGRLAFINSNLIGSNLDVTSDKIRLIKDSLLPNRTFQTSFTKLGLNLIDNGNAEQGQCYHSNESLITTTLDGWIRENDVIQLLYNNSNFQMNMINYTRDWGSCFFFGGNFDSSTTVNLKKNLIEQRINLEQLSVLFDAGEAKFTASAYLGGFDDELSTTVMNIEFKNINNKTTFNTIVGRVTNLDRQNRTMMLFRTMSGTIPKGTVLVDIQLIFQRHITNRRLRLGMADNLRLIIQRK